MKKHLLGFSVALFVFTGLSLSVKAQIGSYAIRNAKIITVSGATIAKGTVVVRDGLIESVGERVQIPADAEIFDGEGLTVYPGFIDANTNIAIQQAPPTPPGQANQPQSNSNYPAVLRPERNVMGDLKAGEAQFAGQRSYGFTTALTGYSDGIFNGDSAVINLAGETVSEMVVRTPFAQHVTYTTNRGGGFPSSLMGTFAALRQMFADAKRLDQIRKMYEKNPRGMKRPESDPALEALIPIVNGEKPLVVNANAEREIIRTIDLAKEFDLRLIIAGGQEAGKVADRLKAQKVPVLLSLNFPKRTVAANEEADPESMNTLRLRVEVPKTAGKLKQAGVIFAFSSDGLKNMADFLVNAEETTKNGLSEADAVRAMTLSAAEILGVSDQLGSIETGKIANLVVIKGDLFDKDKTITHVFVDGKLFKLPKKPEKKTTPANGTIAQVGGTWILSISAPGQRVEATLVLIQTGSTVNGTLSSALFGSSPIKNGAATDKGFTFDVNVSVGAQELSVAFNGTVEGNKVEGIADTPQGPAPFTGTKTP